MMRAYFRGWTIYEKPTDFPAHFVVRKWVLLEGRKDPVPSPEARLCQTLEEARACIPAGMVCLPRYPEDDPKIVEVWI